MERNITPNYRTLHEAADAAREDPLASIFFGSWSGHPQSPAGDVVKLPPRRPLLPYQEVFGHALRYAERLLLHRHGLTKFASILSGQDQPHHLVYQAIRHVFARCRWFLVIDDTLPRDTFGKYVRPADDLPESASLQELTVFVNSMYADLLVSAFLKGSRDDYARQLYLTANGLGHELVHASRLQVLSALRPYPEIPIPASSPYRSALIFQEVGWEWQEAFNGGRLEGAWAYDGSEGSQAGGIELVTGADVSAQDLRRVEIDVDAILGQAVSSANVVLPSTGERVLPFDYLVIRLPKGDTPRAVCLEVEDDWLLQALDLYEGDRLDELILPPRRIAEPLENEAILTLSRQAATKCVHSMGLSRVRGSRHRSGGEKSKK